MKAVAKRLETVDYRTPVLEEAAIVVSEIVFTPARGFVGVENASIGTRRAFTSVVSASAYPLKQLKTSHDHLAAKGKAHR